MEVPIQKRKFISVEYPAVVKNKNKMLATLGGEANINQVFNTPGQRLELRFRPNDMYCKPTCANKHATTKMVLKVKRKKKQSSSSDQYEYEAEILGIVESTYTFTCLSDFQYLPMARKDGNIEYTSLLQDLRVEDIHPASWSKQPMPLHLPPTLFSRIDNPLDYNYRDGPYKSSTVTTDTDNPNIIGVSRKRRPHFTRIVMYENWEVPAEPNILAMKKISKKNQMPLGHKRLTELFKEKPIWSRTSLMMNMEHCHEYLKILLPTVAYYVLTGPWRRVWVRFGYDPRSDPKAKLLQVVDFRIKDNNMAAKLGISVKRSSTTYRLPNKMTKTLAVTPKIKRSELTFDGNSDKGVSQAQKDAYYKFYPGLVPAYRQICYQYCDIDVAEIQSLIHRNDGKETECTEKDGWCLPNTTEQIRRIILEYLISVIREKEKDYKFINLKGSFVNVESRSLAFTSLASLDDTEPDTRSSLADESTNPEPMDDLSDEVNSEEEEIMNEEESMDEDGEIEDG